LRHRHPSGHGRDHQDACAFNDGCHLLCLMSQLLPCPDVTRSARMTSLSFS
jgi:hypothetical protein